MQPSPAACCCAPNGHCRPNALHDKRCQAVPFQGALMQAQQRLLQARKTPTNAKEHNTSLQLAYVRCLVAMLDWTMPWRQLPPPSCSIMASMQSPSSISNYNTTHHNIRVHNATHIWLYRRLRYCTALRSCKKSLAGRSVPALVSCFPKVYHHRTSTYSSGEYFAVPAVELPCRAFVIADTQVASPQSVNLL